MNRPNSFLTIQQIADNCINCKLCVKECKFLDTYSTPGEICKQYLSGELEGDALFKCNLCGLCESVCPKKLHITHSFLDIRKQISAATNLIQPAHKRICNYERYGHSKLFSQYTIPDGCTSVFFPGCTLVSTRSTVTHLVYKHLKDESPTTGIVLDCCHKPSHDLGHTDRFQKIINKITQTLVAKSIEEIIVGCPSCYVTFKEYAPQLKVTSVYQKLSENLPQLSQIIKETVSIHDACMTRFDADIHDSVRELVVHSGANISEVKHSKEKAICCGEGGAAAFTAPEITGNWKTIRHQETGQNRVITYCAGCSSTLGKDINTTHLLDLLFDSKSAKEKKEQNTQSPFTYLRRLQLKRQLKLK